MDPQNIEIFNRFIREVGFNLHLPPTTRRIIKGFSDIDVKTESIVKILNANPYYEHLFLEVVKSMSTHSELDARSAVLRLGMQHTRNLLCALQLFRLVRSAHPALDQNGKLTLSPSDILKYALLAEQAVPNNKKDPFSYPDTAYAAGVLFDILIGLATQKMNCSKKVIGYIDEIFSHGMRTAIVGVELARSMPDFAHKKHVFGACLIHDCGKIVMAMLNPAYLDFVAKCQKEDLPRTLRQYAERQRFGFGHEVFSFLCASFFPIFGVVKESLLYHHEPYLLPSSKRAQQGLVNLICLSTNIANQFNKPADSNDPLIEKWKGLELQGFKINNKDIVEAVGRASAKVEAK